MESLHFLVDWLPKGTMAAVGLSDPNVALIVLSSLIGVLGLVVFLVLRSLSAEVPLFPTKGDALLLLGPMGSGKTVLYFKLLQNLIRETYPSMKENEAAFDPKGLELAPADANACNSLKLVDFPGHGSQRLRVTPFLARARAIVFVVDANTPKKGYQNAAECLYNVLTSVVVVKRKVPVLIACAQSDQPTARSVDDITAELLHHLNSMRGLRHTMADLDPKAVQEIALGKEGQDFDFDQHPCDISVAAISSEKADLAALGDFVKAVL
jgi:signal recognition particle receptor subunit beta